jgi:hypothetical protein
VNLGLGVFRELSANIFETSSSKLTRLSSAFRNFRGADKTLREEAYDVILKGKPLAEASLNGFSLEMFMSILFLHHL